MSIEIKKIDQTVRNLLFTVDKERFERDYKKSFVKFSRKVQIDGYRKGKAPESIINRLYSDQIQTAYYEDFLEIYYREAIAEVDSAVLSQGSLLDVDFRDSGEVVFTFEYESLPEGFTYEYQDLEVPFKPLEYTESLLDDTINKILNDNAEEIPFEADQEICLGDKISLLDVVSGDSLDPFIVSEQKLQDMIKAEIDQVVGKRLKDKFTVEDIEYEIVDAFTIKVPELNDDTAKILGHDSVELLMQTLKADIEKNLEKQNGSEYNYRISMAFGKKNIDNLKIPKDYILNVGKQVIMQHFGNQYPTDILQNFPEESLMTIGNGQRPSIVWDLTFEQVAKDHDITLSDEEFDIELVKFANEFHLEVEDFKTKYAQSLNSLRETLLSNKVCEFLKQYCTIIDPEVLNKLDENKSEDSDSDQ
jgi:trigger factor